MRVNVLIREADGEDREAVALWALAHYQAHPTHILVDHRILETAVGGVDCTTLRLTLKKRPA